MCKTRIDNKRRQTPLIYKSLYHLNLIYTTLLTVKYSKEDYAILKENSNKSTSCIIRKRCRALLAKMSEPTLSCQRIAIIVGCHRNFVRELIHIYNKEGVDSVLRIIPKPGRPGQLKGHLSDIDTAFESSVPKSASEAMSIVEKTCGIKICVSYARQLLHKLGYGFRKLQPIPGKADPEKQEQWVKDIQPIVDETKTGKRKLYFMDAAHFTLEAFLCHVWCKEPLYLRSGAGRNRFNVLGCIDPFTFDFIESHSMVYVDAEQVKEFLIKVRNASGEIPISIVLDNARYQHCNAVKEKAAELNIDLIFLPPYSPNLNIIERLWKYTQRHVLAGKHFASPASFHEALRHFFEDDFSNHISGLSSLLTLNFQSFKNAHLLRA